MSLNDTIVACATPAGYSSIAVIRVSGGKSIELAKKIFTATQHGQHIESHKAYYGDVVDPADGDVIDKVVVTFYCKPHSYTGDDVVEISCHGNPLIIERITKILTNNGARLAERGEFTRQALLNGKIDMLQAEAVLDTVYAQCDEARKLAISQYEGKLSQKIYALRSMIVDLLSLVEADIDFPDEEDVQTDVSVFEQMQRDIVVRCDELLKGAEVGVKIKEGYKVLIMGRVNVGKSTLFNRMLGYDRAIIHEAPGTTRDYIEDHLNFGGLHIWLIDSAGILNKAQGPDRLAQEQVLKLVDEADLILLMFDGAEAINEEDLFLYNLTKQKKRLLVVNKIDLNMKLDESSILSDSTKLSAKSGMHVGSLMEKMKSVLAPKIKSNQALLTRQRHIGAISRVREYVLKSMEAPSPETSAFELHEALQVVGELTGQIMRKDILDKIFEEFCIGK
jgi:tRNA modification GTPase